MDKNIEHAYETGLQDASDAASKVEFEMATRIAYLETELEEAKHRLPDVIRERLNQQNSQIGDLIAERDALMRAIFFEHCLEGRNECLKASVGRHCVICSVLKDIGITRKQIEGGE